MKPNIQSYLNGLDHWHKYIWTACSASKSVIKDGRSMSVFAHEVNCWPVLICTFLYAWRASDVLTTLIFVSIRWSIVLSTDNVGFKAKNIRAGSPDLFMSMLWIATDINLSSILTSGRRTGKFNRVSYGCEKEFWRCWYDFLKLHGYTYSQYIHTLQPTLFIYRQAGDTYSIALAVVLNFFSAQYFHARSSIAHASLLLRN